MEELKKRIEESNYCVAFTGAGVSTLSGIRDFRGKDGIYMDSDIDAGKIFDIECFKTDPGYYYSHAKDFVYPFESITPNIVHIGLARLQKNGKIRDIITQNIDLLHSLAGSSDVIELHGSVKTHSCLGCGARYLLEAVIGTVRKGEVPFCPECGGVIKPDITFFGEMLDTVALNRAVSAARRCDLMMVLGSTLLVQPAASIPEYALQGGADIIIVNDGATPLDRYAALRYSDLKTVFEYIRDTMAE
jgi:NAD-dependent deacetylase